MNSLPLAQLLALATEHGASVLHLEPTAEGLRIRARLDGHLQGLGADEIDASAILAALAEATGCSLETPTPEQGTVVVEGPRGRQAVRFQTVPTLLGTKVVLELLDEASDTRAPGLDALGLSQEDRAEVEGWLGRDGGALIILGGAPGSGRGALAGACLMALTERGAMEAQPVPRAVLDGVEQWRLDDPAWEELELNSIPQRDAQARALALRERFPALDRETMARRLRDQPPGALYYRELIDVEATRLCLELAVRHRALVLTTLQVQHPIDLLARLHAQGIEARELVRAGLVLRHQARLRRLCPQCRKPQPMPPAALRGLGLSPEEADRAQLFEAVGCGACHEGHRGWIIASVTTPMAPRELERAWRAPNWARLRATTARQGAPTLRQAALARALQGEVSLTEALLQTPR